MRRGLGMGQGDLDLSSLTLIQGKNLKTSFQYGFLCLLMVPMAI